MPYFLVADDKPLIPWHWMFSPENHKSSEDTLDWVYVYDDGMGRKDETRSQERTVGSSPLVVWWMIVRGSGAGG